MLTDQQQQSVVLEVENTCEAVLAPLQKAEHALHSWEAFLIMPVFALANAGVALSLAQLAGENRSVALGILIGLVLGKPVGLLGAARLAVRTGLTVLPPGVSSPHLVGVGLLAGIGFTMSLFIAALGLGEGPLLETAKLGIFGASLVSGTIGYLVLSRLTLQPDTIRAPATQH